MKRINIIICILLLVTIFSAEVYSQVTLCGGKGLSKVLEAEPVRPADIFVNSNFTAFTKKLNSKRLAHYYNININATVGLASNMEFVFNFVPYHEDQNHLFGNIGNTTLGLKYLTPLASDVFKFGLYGYFRIPTADSSNVLYEPFTSEDPAWGLNALVTIDLIDIFPTFPIKWNINLGYIDNSVKDQYFTSKIDQMFIGTGFKFSIRNIQLFLEYTGEIFINNRAVDFSQNSTRITPGVRFMGPWRNTIDISMNIGLTQYNDLKNTTLFHKEYSGWNLLVGVTHRFSVYKYFDKTAKLEKRRQEEELRRLEAIKKKREKAKQDLEKMKKILDEKKSKEGNTENNSGK